MIWVLGLGAPRAAGDCWNLGCPQVSRQPLPALLSFPRLKNDKYAKHGLIKHAIHWLIKWLLGLKRKPC